MLDLGVINETMWDILLKPLYSSTKTKLFNGTLLLVQIDARVKQEEIAIGCIVYDPNGHELLGWGDIDFGTAPN